MTEPAKPTPQQIENLTAWADALESNIYSQTQNCLRDNIGYCCLGVASELHNQLEFLKEKGFRNSSWVFKTNRSNELPTDKFMLETFGMPLEVFRDLANRNDGSAKLNCKSGLYHKHTFSEIAQLIRNFAQTGQLTPE